MFHSPTILYVLCLIIILTLASAIYVYFYPLQALVLFSNLFKRKEKKDDDVFAVKIKPGKKPETDATGDSGTYYASASPDNQKDPFIPENDSEFAESKASEIRELEIEEEDFLEDDQDQSTEYIRIKDL